MLDPGQQPGVRIVAPFVVAVVHRVAEERVDRRERMEGQYRECERVTEAGNATPACDHLSSRVSGSDVRRGAHLRLDGHVMHVAQPDVVPGLFQISRPMGLRRGWDKDVGVSRVAVGESSGVEQRERFGHPREQLQPAAQAPGFGVPGSQSRIGRRRHEVSDAGQAGDQVGGVANVRSSQEHVWTRQRQPAKIEFADQRQPAIQPGGVRLRVEAQSHDCGPAVCGRPCLHLLICAQLTHQLDRAIVRVMYHRETGDDPVGRHVMSLLATS
jgi:hypothetical protein